MQQEEEEEEEEASRPIIGKMTHIPKTENMELQRDTVQEWVGPQEVPEREKG